jgi:hypothetical protein
MRPCSNWGLGGDEAEEGELGLASWSGETTGRGRPGSAPAAESWLGLGGTTGKGGLALHLRQSCCGQRLGGCGAMASHWPR